MAFDPNRSNSETAARFQKHVDAQTKRGFDTLNHGARNAGGQKQGGLLGFLIVVGLMAIVGLWIASQQ